MRIKVEVYQNENLLDKILVHIPSRVNTVKDVVYMILGRVPIEDPSSIDLNRCHLLFDDFKIAFDQTVDILKEDETVRLSIMGSENAQTNLSTRLPASLTLGPGDKFQSRRKRKRGIGSDSSCASSCSACRRHTRKLRRSIGPMNEPMVEKKTSKCNILKPNLEKAQQRGSVLPRLKGSLSQKKDHKKLSSVSSSSSESRGSSSSSSSSSSTSSSKSRSSSSSSSKSSNTSSSSSSSSSNSSSSSSSSECRNNNNIITTTSSGGDGKKSNLTLHHSDSCLSRSATSATSKPKQVAAKSSASKRKSDCYLSKGLTSPSSQITLHKKTTTTAPINKNSHRGDSLTSSSTSISSSSKNTLKRTAIPKSRINKAVLKNSNNQQPITHVPNNNDSSHVDISKKVERSPKKIDSQDLKLGDKIQFQAIQLINSSPVLLEMTRGAVTSIDKDTISIRSLEDPAIFQSINMSALTNISRLGQDGTPEERLQSDDGMELDAQQQPKTKKIKHPVLGHLDVPIKFAEADIASLVMCKMISVRGAIRRQMDYYFSEQNYPTDKFLKNAADAEGWIPLKLICAFNRIKSLTNDVDFIRDAIKDLTNTELSPCGTKVRSRHRRPYEPNRKKHTKPKEEIIDSTKNCVEKGTTRQRFSSVESAEAPEVI